MSDAVATALIAAVAPVVSAAVLAWVARRAQVAVTAAVKESAAENKQAASETKAATRVVAAKAEEVRATLESSTSATDAKLDRLTRTTDVIHELSNSGKLAMLRVIADLRRREAERPGSTEADREAATAAEKEYQEHAAKQATLDAGGKP